MLPGVPWLCLIGHPTRLCCQNLVHATCVFLHLSTVAAIAALPLPSAFLCLNLLVHAHLTLYTFTFADYQ